MQFKSGRVCVWLTLLFVTVSNAQKTCTSGLAINAIDPFIVSKGFTARVIASDLTTPRGIAFDKEGNLLVVEKTKGITALQIKEEGNCITAVTKKTVITDPTLNHAIQFSPDSAQLWASSNSTVYSWDYTAKTAEAGARSIRIIGLEHRSGRGHSSRTLLMSKKVPGMLLVSRGSDGNIDPQTRSITSGVSQIRLFNVTGVPQQVQYTDGKVIAWGLRNSVGLGENPKDGGLWSNENSSDWMGRDEGDIHEDSPGEEINYHGDLLGKSELHGKNYGYPECAAVWRVDNLPRNSKLEVGMQFTHNGTAPGINDETCARDFVPPRITLPSHWAPLDIEFNTRGDVAYMTAHGSWNKEHADGYELFAITFDADGQPTHPPTSKTAAIPILRTKNMRTCRRTADQSPQKCFRPVGVAFDTKGRLYMSSDSTGEVYVIEREDGGSVDAVPVAIVEAIGA